MANPFKKMRGVTDKQLKATFEEHARVINILGRLIGQGRRRNLWLLVLVLINSLAIIGLVLGKLPLP